MYMCMCMYMYVSISLSLYIYIYKYIYIFIIYMYTHIMYTLTCMGTGCPPGLRGVESEGGHGRQHLRLSPKPFACLCLLSLLKHTKTTRTSHSHNYVFCLSRDRVPRQGCLNLELQSLLYVLHKTCQGCSRNIRHSLTLAKGCCSQ